MDDFAASCLALDLEVGRKDGRIHAFAAVREGAPPLIHRSGGLASALARLDDFAEGATYVLGHNLIAFDLPHLQAAKPGLRLLRLPPIDTLRLNPLAFPRNPYHHLVKHYQDGQLKGERVNDPELDARLSLQLLADQREALGKAPPDLLAAWHWLTTAAGAQKQAGGLAHPLGPSAQRSTAEQLDVAKVRTAGFNAFFASLRQASRPAVAEAREAIRQRLAKAACRRQSQEVLEQAAQHGWALAYALAWLSVAGGNSVMPPWVRHQFPEAGRLVRRLRDLACADPACHWCRERQDARKELKRWFGFNDFRPEPKDSQGRPMQQSIVEAAMAGESVLGILPTGTGKSLCYQLPALSRYDKTGALTVVISPLVALMADQVTGMERQGIGCAVTVNGLLSLPERKEALDRVRLGDAGILIIAPEQLRSVSVRQALAQREIGAFVLDEAHCLSRWGHDFRPDYRYVTRFIREKAADAPVLCLTATAKPEVREDIVRHFREPSAGEREGAPLAGKDSAGEREGTPLAGKDSAGEREGAPLAGKPSGVDLKVFDGGANRANLKFVVVQTTPGEKFSDIHQILEADLPKELPGGAIVYCATRRRSEDIAEFLSRKDVAAEHFHAGLSPEVKKTVQQRFIDGELRVIVATNAFGMGIDKPDVRLVIHADIPGSLENYLQEAGRAGRDRAPARCVLLYTAEDVERQFSLSARSRLTQREIQGILKALRNLDRKKRLAGEVVATSGEILVEDEEAAFERDSATDDTRVRTAISWLEEAQLLTREENRVQVFPSSLRVNSLAEARTKLAKREPREGYRVSLLAIAKALIEADPDEGISTDELVGVSGLTPEAVRHAMFDLETLGIASNDTALTAFVHAGVQRASRKRLEEAADLEVALIEALQEAAPDMQEGDRSDLHLRIITQRLKDAGHAQALPERIWRILRSIAADGRDEGDGKGSLGLRRRDLETVRVTLQRSWKDLAETALRRRGAAQRLLEHLLGCLPPSLGGTGTDLLAETTFGKLRQALKSDLELKARVAESEKLAKLLDRALLWLHEQEVVRLNKGLAVFRPAMTIHLGDRQRRFLKANFMPLDLHYKDQVLQIHVMAEFAQRGLSAMAEALRLAMDYFSLSQKDFLRRWLPRGNEDLARETTPESWRSIVESLKNPAQQEIVADDEERNVLVLAGPGSGKTRVLVHRIAYLLRVRRENPRGIIALAYNRHAAVEIRRRLAELVGDDVRGVLVYTCHGLAMRLVGASFGSRAKQPDDDAFKDVMRQAVALLRGDGLPPEEVDEHRTRLLAGFRWILVDEYQDIGPEQYELISALAGRTLAEEDDKLSLFAVGDDDQNIYAWAGASVRFIRRFEADYQAKPVFLTDNYRSTAHIIAAANAAIEPAAERMKAQHTIRVNQGRAKAKPGGDWETLDPVARGRVQILISPDDPIAQAQAAMVELQRLSALTPDWDWSACAAIARKWRYLEPVRAWCELNDVPVQMGNEQIPNFWRLRETQALCDWLRGRANAVVNGAALRQWLARQRPGPWIELLHEALEEHELETGGAEAPAEHFMEWLAEWGREVRRRQRGLLLVTAHRAKGLEFDHVVVLDGGWRGANQGEDADAPRRLYYVAMTRARKTLALMRFQEGPNAHRDSFAPGRARRRTSRAADERIHDRVEAPPPPPYLAESHPLPAVPQSNASVLRRQPASLPPGSPALRTRHRRLAMKDVDLGFAGRSSAGDPLHRAIAELAPGDPLTLRENGDRWELFNGADQRVGRLAKRFVYPPGMRCLSATVLAIVAWSRDRSEPKYQDSVKCDSWEVVVPEVRFVADDA